MRIAFIAHDEQKADLIDFVDEHIELLDRFDCLATGSTGERLEEETELGVERVESGSHGGDMIVGAAVATGDCDGVIFLRDPLTAKPHEPDIMALLRVCDVHDVPFATNRSSAEMMMDHLAE